MKPCYVFVESSYAYLLFENATYRGLGRELYLLPRDKFQSGRWHP